MVEDEDKVREIHDLTFGDRVTIRGSVGIEEQEAYMELGGRSVNADT